jgi:Xaa-Pro dipeptidase
MTDTGRGTDRPGPTYSTRLHFGPTTNDVHEGINVERMRRERAARMREIMTAAGAPAILVTGSENVRYLTGFLWSEFQLQAGYALFFVDDDPVVYAPAGSYHQMPDQAPWIRHWRIARSWLGGTIGDAAADMEAKLFAEEIAAELNERGLRGEPLAVSEFDDRALRALQERGIETRPGLALLLDSARIKTRDEIKLPFDELAPFHQMLAVIETLAHLDLLVDQGRLAAAEQDGVRMYSPREE